MLWGSSWNISTHASINPLCLCCCDESNPGGISFGESTSTSTPKPKAEPKPKPQANPLLRVYKFVKVEKDKELELVPLRKERVKQFAVHQRETLPDTSGNLRTGVFDGLGLGIEKPLDVKTVRALLKAVTRNELGPSGLSLHLARRLEIREEEEFIVMILTTGVLDDDDCFS